jgi:hypothetical protein
MAYRITSIYVPSSRWEVKFLYKNTFTKSAAQNTDVEMKKTQKRIIWTYKVQRLYLKAESQTQNIW